MYHDPDVFWALVRGEIIKELKKVIIKGEKNALYFISSIYVLDKIIHYEPFHYNELCHRRNSVFSVSPGVF